MKRNPTGIAEVFLHHKQSGRFIAIYDGLILGRAGGKKDGTQDPLLSGLHCKIRVYKAGIVTLEDLDSTNGTEFNGKLLAPGKRVSLVAGDSIKIGSQRFVVTQERPATALIQLSPEAAAAVAAAVASRAINYTTALPSSKQSPEPEGPTKMMAAAPPSPEELELEALEPAPAPESAPAPEPAPAPESAPAPASKAEEQLMAVLKPAAAVRLRPSLLSRCWRRLPSPSRWWSSKPGTAAARVQKRALVTPPPRKPEAKKAAPPPKSEPKKVAPPVKAPKPTPSPKSARQSRRGSKMIPLTMALSVALLVSAVFLEFEDSPRSPLSHTAVAKRSAAPLDQCSDSHQIYIRSWLARAILEADPLSAGGNYADSAARYVIATRDLPKELNDCPSIRELMNDSLGKVAISNDPKKKTKYLRSLFYGVIQAIDAGQKPEASRFPASSR